MISHFRTLILGMAVFFLSVFPVRSQDVEDRESVEASIRSYVAAFNQKDATALAAQWTQDGDYVDATGRYIRGKEAILQAYLDYFSRYEMPHISITLTAARFAGEDLAIVDGYRDVGRTALGPETRIRFTSVHVKRNGNWLIQSVRDAVAFKPSNYEHLKDLEWAIGEWGDETPDGAVVHHTCTWSPDRNFIIRTFTTSLGGNVLINGTQWVGWDPIRKQIRSWRFDSSGGFGEAVWSHEGNQWVVDATSVLQCGSQVRETHIITLIDPDTIRWETKNRTIDGKPLPDVEKVTVSRRR